MNKLITEWRSYVHEALQTPPSIYDIIPEGEYHYKFNKLERFVYEYDFVKGISLGNILKNQELFVGLVFKIGPRLMMLTPDGDFVNEDYEEVDVERVSYRPDGEPVNSIKMRLVPEPSVSDVFNQMRAEFEIVKSYPYKTGTNKMKVENRNLDSIWLMRNQSLPGHIGPDTLDDFQEIAYVNGLKIDYQQGDALPFKSSSVTSLTWGNGRYELRGNQTSTPTLFVDGNREKFAEEKLTIHQMIEQLLK